MTVAVPKAEGSWRQSLPRNLLFAAATALFFYAVATWVANYGEGVDLRKAEQVKQETEAWVSYLPAHPDTPEEKMLARWIRVGDPTVLFQTRGDSQGFGALQRRQELLYPVEPLPSNSLAPRPGPKSPYEAGALGQGPNFQAAAAVTLLSTPAAPSGTLSGKIQWLREDGTPLPAIAPPTLSEVAVALDKEATMPDRAVRIEVSLLRQRLRCRLLTVPGQPGGASGNAALDALALESLYRHLERSGALFRDRPELPEELKAPDAASVVVQLDYRADPEFYRTQRQKGSVRKEAP